MSEEVQTTSEYRLRNVAVPPLLHPSKTVDTAALDQVPMEDEIRYLGNMKNYCSFFAKKLSHCQLRGALKEDPKLYQRCMNDLEDLHNCWYLREPTDLKFQHKFFKETESCAFQRDVFVKCFFQGALHWDRCEEYHVNIYRCLHRKHPKELNIW